MENKTVQAVPQRLVKIRVICVGQSLKTHFCNNRIIKWFKRFFILIYFMGLFILLILSKKFIY
jgi:hypothetical protein